MAQVDITLPVSRDTVDKFRTSSVFHWIYLFVPRHWLLILAEEGAEYGTYYHSVHGPEPPLEYYLEIVEKRVNSRSIEYLYEVAEISAQDKGRVKRAAQSVTPRFCQRYVVDVLRKLEAKGLVPAGTTDTWAAQMEFDSLRGDVPSGKGHEICRGSHHMYIPRDMHTRHLISFPRFLLSTAASWQIPAIDTGTSKAKERLSSKRAMCFIATIEYPICAFQHHGPRYEYFTSLCSDARLTPQGHIYSCSRSSPFVSSSSSPSYSSPLSRRSSSSHPSPSRHAPHSHSITRMFSPTACDDCEATWLHNWDRTVESQTQTAIQSLYMFAMHPSVRAHAIACLQQGVFRANQILRENYQREKHRLRQVLRDELEYAKAIFWNTGMARPVMRDLPFNTCRGWTGYFPPAGGEGRTGGMNTWRLDYWYYQNEYRQIPHMARRHVLNQIHWVRGKPLSAGTSGKLVREEKVEG
ncbi:hypothetical protein QBC35DRAFT_473626 [Podospora australis]|uniref:Uncharacterized protein n=1 Tax=Podospora australis TaxID=1536484 RepID=A0AAN6WUK6_9PEZI|nr:hypothetical protein QBC35DRAFT_473626 [Podospora australis]